MLESLSLLGGGVMSLFMKTIQLGSVVSFSSQGMRGALKASAVEFKRAVLHLPTWFVDLGSEVSSLLPSSARARVRGAQPLRMHRFGRAAAKVRRVRAGAVLK